jgi:ribosomal protein S18 acetylase RimI-like enzyme
MPPAFLEAEIEPLARAFRKEMDTDPSGERRSWVCRRGAEVIGFADTGPCRDADAVAGQAELYTLHVSRSQQRAGVGSALLATAIDDLRQRGWRLVTAWVLRENHSARRFYETQGWRWDGHTLTERIGSATLHEVRYALHFSSEH